MADVRRAVTSAVLREAACGTVNADTWVATTDAHCEVVRSYVDRFEPVRLAIVVKLPSAPMSPPIP